MTIQHKNIVDAQLHEPKGVASATAGQLYRSNGAGSGAWVNNPMGWGYYNDGGAAQILTTSFTKLSIDGAGSTTVESYLPRAIGGVSSLWDVAADKITPIALGDSYSLRIDIPVTSKTSTPTELVIKLDIGGTSSPTNVIVERREPITSAPPYLISFGFPIFCRNDFLANGGQLFVKVDVGTLTITNPDILLVRTSDGTW